MNNDKEDHSAVIALFDRTLEASENLNKPIDPSIPADAMWIGASTTLILLTRRSDDGKELTPEQKYDATRGALYAGRELWRANSVVAFADSVCIDAQTLAHCCGHILYRSAVRIASELHSLLQGAGHVRRNAA